MKETCDTCEHQGDSSNEYCGSCDEGTQSNWKEAGWIKDKKIIILTKALKKMKNRQTKQGGAMTKMLQEDWKKEYDYAGSFQTALMKLIEHADNENLTKLEREYPNIVQAYRKFSGR